MRALAAVVVVLALAGRGSAQTFFFHHADTPVTVPGGSSSFFLDATTPTAVTPLVEEVMLGVGASGALPTFIATPFAADTLLAPMGAVIANLSANKVAQGCVDVGVMVFRVAPDGGLTSIGSVVTPGQTLPQSEGGGSAGFVTLRFEFAVTDTAIGAGGSIAATVTLTNHCVTNRRVFLAYDGSPSPTKVTFSLGGKCQAAKLKAAGKGIAGEMGCYSRAKAKSGPLDLACLVRADGKTAAAIIKVGNACAGSPIAIQAAITSCVNQLVTDVPGNGKCPSSSAKAVGKAAGALLVCESKDVTSQPGSLTACDAKNDAKLGGALTKAGACADFATVHPDLHTCNDTLTELIVPPAGP